MEFETIGYDEEGFVGVLTLRRPEAMNALNARMLEELGELCAKISEKKAIRALILTGAGEKAFVAGADIKAMSAMSVAEAEAFSLKGQVALGAIKALPFAVIAAVNGFALGGGCELALACDIVVGSENAKFGLPETGLGLMPGFGGTQRLARSVGLFKAREMIFTGALYSAEEAFQMGLLSRVVPAASLMDEARKIAQAISAKSPIAIAQAKRAIDEGFDQLLSDGLRQEAHLFAKLFSTRDRAEGIAAFMEKRSPRFEGA